MLKGPMRMMVTHYLAAQPNELVATAFPPGFTMVDQRLYSCPQEAIKWTSGQGGGQTESCKSLIFMEWTGGQHLSTNKCLPARQARPNPRARVELQAAEDLPHAACR